MHFVEQPQFRLAGAEDAIRLCTERLQTLIRERESKNKQLAKELAEEYTKLAPMLGSLTQGKMFKSEKRRTAGAIWPIGCGVGRESG